MSRRRPAIAAVRFGQDSSDVLDLALVGVVVVAAVVALLVGLWGIAVLGAVPSLAADVLRGERPLRLRRLVRRVLLDRPERSLVRNGSVAAAVAATPPTSVFANLAFLLIAVMVLHLALTAYTALGVRRTQRERAGITWRHLQVAGETEGPGELPDPVQDRLPVDGLRLLTASEVLVLGGFALAAAGVGVLPWLLALVVLAITGWTLWTAWRAWGPRGGHRVRDSDVSVAQAVADLAPEVVLYFSSPADGTYALGVWASVINACERPVLVVLREPAHLAGVETILKPTIVVPTVTDLVAVTPLSVRVVLYPTNVVKNNEMIRIPGPMHCFIGHGDSDKVGSFSPLNRMYDEIWVAGRAAVERYAAVDEGIDLNVVRPVGRPQLADIRRAAPEAAMDGHRLTVLYAPTWEGFFDEADYSSVAALGERIVQGCLDAGADVLFKPHPLTGHRLPEAGKAREAIDDLVRKAGGGSEVVAPSPNSLYEAFNRADLLISDISSVITDFLASRKPYAVSNRRDVPDLEFRRLFPSASAAELLGSDLAALPAALADAAGADPRRAQREALAMHLLGPEGDPMVVFLREIDDFVARSDARLAGTVRR
ncbi:CDP-glycerol glycerophosphotransferase family protein [uncultured Amnibacterium sp.]|uniref:CDP-glycerol glycerophosphotransferase family protein n=1 Tax=uncultured Amnibacterium sp. TaxID=1631851 RepID=UPI0035CC3DBA